MTLNPNAMPIELRGCDQWVCWASRRRDGKQTKVPLDPSTGRFASTADAETWGSFETALDHARQPSATGIGFVFTADDPYVGIDIDDCREPDSGVLSDDAVEILSRLHSYTEVSPSGTGLHVIARGNLPSGQRRRGGVEMYDRKRFFTMTGERVQATPETVNTRPGPIQTIHERFVAPQQADDTSQPDSTTQSSLSAPTSLDDRTLLQKARKAKNGEKFSRLWNGDTSGYDSQSEADMALCCLLAFWTGRDTARIDRLFQRSGLMRPKWDEVHYADGATYGERTVERACREVVGEGYTSG